MARGRGDVAPLAAEPRCGDLESVRAPVGTQRDRLAVGDQVRHRQRERRLDDLGQPRGDVVEAAGVDRHVVARAVDLDPRAVELGLENGLAAESFEGFGDAGRGLGQHRPDRLADLEGELATAPPLRRSAPPPRRRAGRRRSIAARRTVAAGTPAALATASAITPASAPWRSSPPSRRRRNVCSASVAAANRSATSSARRACEPLPATVADLGERRVDGRDRQRRLLRRAPAATAAPPSRRRSGAAAGRPTARTRRRRPASASPRSPARRAVRRSGRSWPAAPRRRRPRPMRWRRRSAAHPQPGTTVRHLPAGR